MKQECKLYLSDIGLIRLVAIVMIVGDAPYGTT